MHRFPFVSDLIDCVDPLKLSRQAGDEPVGVKILLERLPLSVGDHQLQLFRPGDQHRHLNHFAWIEVKLLLRWCGVPSPGSPKWPERVALLALFAVFVDGKFPGQSSVNLILASGVTAHVNAEIIERLLVFAETAVIRFWRSEFHKTRDPGPCVVARNRLPIVRSCKTRHRGKRSNLGCIDAADANLVTDFHVIDKPLAPVAVAGNNKGIYRVRNFYHTRIGRFLKIHSIGPILNVGDLSLSYQNVDTRVVRRCLGIKISRVIDNKIRASISVLTFEVKGPARLRLEDAKAGIGKWIGGRNGHFAVETYGFADLQIRQQPTAGRAVSAQNKSLLPGR